MGPILSLQAARRGEWDLAAVIVAREAPGDLVLAVGGRDHAIVAEPLWTCGRQTAYRYRFTVPLADAASTVRYQLDDRWFTIALPAAGAAPTMAYASCNGFSSAKLMKRVAEKNAVWQAMAARHSESPYHLLLLGGDQVYADAMWDTVAELRDWARKSYSAGNKARASAAMIAAVERFFFNLYVERWSQPEVAAMLACVPNIAMWDDHDLLDGWGSYPDARQQCDVFQRAIWPAAARAFRTFQQQLLPEERHPASISPHCGYSRAHVVGPIAILALDMRSERTSQQVMTAGHWRDVFVWLQQLAGPRHLLLMSSIPVVYPGFDTLERLLGAVPGQQELEDDLRDHWNSRAHKGERLRLIHRLLQLAQDQLVLPTIVSGDVHVAALGVIESSDGERGRGVVINQLISSSIVHPGPGAAVLFALRHLFDSVDEMDLGMRARMVEFPGTQERFIGRRNYLSLEPDAAAGLDRIWANWIVEGERDPYTKVIHPIEQLSDGSTIGIAAAVSTA